jgi:hypothetical protein
LNYRKLFEAGKLSPKIARGIQHSFRLDENLQWRQGREFDAVHFAQRADVAAMSSHTALPTQVSAIPILLIFGASLFSC